MVEAFQDLSRRFGEPPEPPGPVAAGRVRVARLLAADPGGGWVAERDGRVVGCSMGLIREGVWGLSLLVVSPEAVVCPHSLAGNHLPDSGKVGEQH